MADLPGMVPGIKGENVKGKEGNVHAKSATILLCDPGQVQCPLWISSSSSFTWDMHKGPASSADL
jgi:hypothetical protein